MPMRDCRGFEALGLDFNPAVLSPKFANLRVASDCNCCIIPFLSIYLLFHYRSAEIKYDYNMRLTIIILSLIVLFLAIRMQEYRDTITERDRIRRENVLLKEGLLKKAALTTIEPEARKQGFVYGQEIVKF